MSVNHFLRTVNSISLVAAVAYNELALVEEWSVAYCTLMFKNFVGPTLKMYSLNAFLEFFQGCFAFFNLKMALLTFKSDNF